MSSLYETESVGYCREQCCVLNFPRILFCQFSFLSFICSTCAHIYRLLPNSTKNAQISLTLQKNKPTKFPPFNSQPPQVLPSFIHSLKKKKCHKPQHSARCQDYSSEQNKASALMELHSGRETNNEEDNQDSEEKLSGK